MTETRVSHGTAALAEMFARAKAEKRAAFLPYFCIGYPNHEESLRAIESAAALGVDPRPLVITVMVAASASFATPIGYQTNTLVYGPGGYSFTDFIKIGLPLNLCIGILTSILVPLFWPL